MQNYGEIDKETFLSGVDESDTAAVVYQKLKT